MRIHLLAISILGTLCAFGQQSYSLVADGKTETYTLIQQSGFYPETSGNTTPDEFMCHPEYPHISQVWDDDLNKYVFAFDIHIDFDQDGQSVTDGNKSSLSDRQRNEIKCMSDKEGTVAKDGESITYSWKFKLPEGMLTTKEFCHIHQIKGMGDGEEVAHPVFTLTCRTTTSRQVLQVINVPYEGSANVNIAQIDLLPLLGKWIMATETVTVGQHGKYSLKLSDIKTGESLVSVYKDDIQVYRYTTDESTMRGKWGIYRSLGSDLNLKDQLQSERLLFADFEVKKENAAVNEIYSGENIYEEPYYDLMGRKVENPTRGIYIRKGEKIYIK